jgi:hypothetical protein
MAKTYKASDARQLSKHVKILAASLVTAFDDSDDHGAIERALAQDLATAAQARKFA